MAEVVASMLFAEDVLFPNSDKQDKEDSDFIFLSLLVASVTRQDRLRIQGYAEHTVPQYQMDDFRRFFRVTRGTFETLCTNMAAHAQLNPSWTGGRDPIPVSKHLLIVLWYLATQDTIHNIADRFNVTDASIIRCRSRVFKVFLDDLKAIFIVWPRNQELQQVMDKFYEKRNIPGVVGAIDGSHIRIKAPKVHSQTYVNRKGFHSVVLQGVCREDMRFIHCVAGWPGSCHDSRVLKNTDIWNLAPQLCGQGHLLGDAAYPLRKWLMTPYRDNGHLTQNQKHYNTKQSSARVVIERAFALLKGRFRRLHYLDTHELKTAVDTIIVCCIVHNICIINEEDVQDFFLDDHGQNIGNIILVHENDAEGARKRNIIAGILP